ncbi:MAG TPA: 4-hydroxy-tetrahydrodipicolinate synthase [Bryobacteraceae bacterium]|jgi:4-hydroxy-tetrahydrodipicolinate synthase|nr:4-hydroxy-tetrahydrodipicolinate synthase [Bryobacteraceae bacterium]
MSADFTGCGTAMVTPFQKDGSLDEATLRKLVARQIDQGIDFLVPCGTTGESPTLSREEHLRVVAITVEEAAGRVPVLAGAGGYNTREVIELAKECEKAGADGILSVTPYYNKPTQEGLYQHYRVIANDVALPIIVYSVQGRTSVNVEPATLGRLAEIENIVGVKEASGSIAQIANVVHEVPEGFLVLSGDDVMTIPVISLGGHGVISVVSNQIPQAMSDLTEAAVLGDYSRARLLQREYMHLFRVNFVETNPIPVKWGMAAMGLLAPVYRLPLVEPSAANRKLIEKAVEQLAAHI